MPDVAANEDGTHQCSPKSTLTPDSSLAHDDMVPQRSPSATNSVHEPLNQQRAGKEDESKDEKRRTNRETEGKAINEMTRDDDRNGRLESEWGAHEGLPEEDLLRGEKTMTVVRQKREVEIGGDGVRETRMPRSKSSSMQADEVRGRSAQKAESRSRHLSHPRTQHKHKNESQLRFDGTMDFETTTRRLYRNCEEKKERDGMRKRVTRARDLFKPSDEVDLFNSQRTDKFDGATTYALCFQNKQYCPVMDLDTSQSDYVFREETGSHKYYCSVSRLS